MFNISKIRPKSLLGPVKAHKFSRCLILVIEMFSIFTETTLCQTHGLVPSGATIPNLFWDGAHAWWPLLTDKLVNGIVVIKGDEGEATLLAGLLVGDDVDGLDVSVVLEVVPEVLVRHVVLDATHEDLLDGHVGLGFAGFL